MKKIVLLALLGVLLAVNGCRKQDTSVPADLSDAPDPAALDAFIREKLLAEEQFLWSWASDGQVWTALANSDQVLSVGYQPAGETNLHERIHRIDFQSPVWRQARAEVLAIILESERELNPVLQEAQLFAFAENVLPVLDVYVHNPATITALRRSGLVRYAEPIGYEPYMRQQSGERSSSGCGSNNAATGLQPNIHYFTIDPGCKQSWNHSYHKITEAWNNSTGYGAGITVIDTGCSDDQENLGDDVDQGWSGGRSIAKYVTLPQATFLGFPTGDPETPHDLCGHGTSMLGAAGAPRGIDGNATGIAYSANLVSIRAAADVFLDESREIVGTSNAFIQAAGGEGRIISLSMGRLTSASQLTDAIVYAHNSGKMIFAAAGTSFSWTAWFTGVIFPATLSQCIAVTGMRTNLTSRCNACHSGSKVDFVLVMERTVDGRHPLSVAMSGDSPSTVGGSSVSTASTAAIAALVWAKYPGWTRQQVFDRLKTSSNYYPTRHPSFGWGRINAQTATN